MSHNAKTYIPKYECIPDFLSPDESRNLFDWLEPQRGFVVETGSCHLAPTHATVQWGLRQGYLSCVPRPYRAKSSGPIPDYLVPLMRRIQERYTCVFNSVQVNKHFNEKAVVHSHADSPAGHICMVSVGAEREFVLRRRRPYFTEFARVKLANGSLLTFFPREQWKHSHEMPRSAKPCGARYALVFRYISQALVPDGVIDKKTSAERKLINRARDTEYEAAQKSFAHKS